MGSRTLARGDKTVAEKAAAGQHGKTRTQRNIAVISRPDGLDGALSMADVHHFIAGKPGAAAANKLPLQLTVQAHPGNRRRQRRQQTQRAGQARLQPVVQAIVGETKAGGHDQQVMLLRQRQQRRVQGRPVVFIVQEAGDIGGAKFGGVVTQHIQQR
jgi:hypothetical protein